MRYVFVLLLSICVLGCYYDSEEDLYGTTDCNITESTYSQDVLPILEEYCYGCHSEAVNSGNITLEGYDRVKPFADSGQLLGSVNWDPGFSAMPKNQAQLVECDIEKISIWISEGAMNN